MRIAFMGIKGLPSRFGADRVVESLVEQLCARHEVTVYACGALFPDRPSFSRFRQIYVASLPGKHLRMATTMIFATLHALARGRYDVVHVHNLETGFVVPLLRLRFRVVITSHGSAYMIDKWSATARGIMRCFEWIALRTASAVTAVSKPQAERYRGETNREVRWIPNGIRQPLPCDIEAGIARLQQSGAPTRGFVLFMAGRIIPIKGCHLLLEALARSGRQVPVVIVGEMGDLPDYTDELRRSAPAGVHFIGFVEDPVELFGIVSRARLFVFPSLIEAMSMALLEVAALGVPALVSDIAENRAVLGDEHVTFFASGDARDLERKLIACLEEPESASKKAQAAQGFVRETYDWGRIARQYEGVYG